MNGGTCSASAARNVGVPTTGERKALWFLAIVALSGSGVRLWRANEIPPEPVDTLALSAQLARVDSVRARGGTRPKHPRLIVAAPPDSALRDPAPIQMVDLDRATADEIEALPGIGPALARRIVANRDSVGAYGHIDALCAVPGIGKSIVQRLRPLVTFTGARRPVSDECGGASKRPRGSHGGRDVKSR